MRTAFCRPGPLRASAPVSPPMWLVAGLGNPGLAYARTRHNCGFMVLDILAEQLGVRLTRARFHSAYERVNDGSVALILLKPETYMNDSGLAVREAAAFFKIPHERILVVYDDVDLPAGRLRLREKGGPGTHNGMRSIVRELGGGNFPRLRVGVGPADPRMDLADFVLGRIPEAEQEGFFAAMKTAADCVRLAASRPRLDAAMRLANDFGKPAAQEAAAPRQPGGGVV